MNDDPTTDVTLWYDSTMWTESDFYHTQRNMVRTGFHGRIDRHTKGSILGENLATDMSVFPLHVCCSRAVGSLPGVAFVPGGFPFQRSRSHGAHGQTSSLDADRPRPVPVGPVPFTALQPQRSCRRPRAGAQGRASARVRARGTDLGRPRRGLVAGPLRADQEGNPRRRCRRRQARHEKVAPRGAASARQAVRRVDDWTLAEGACRPRGTREGRVHRLPDAAGGGDSEGNPCIRARPTRRRVLGQRPGGADGRPARTDAASHRRVVVSRYSLASSHTCTYSTSNSSFVLPRT